ncbi:hypothetical protein HHK36_002045 [Tetracentron sinense]|uniref:Disease resistance RPP13-like protein 4 n=1 Tax=Tetracentron sinense TaxID=13715 RepID=A0A835DS45_TETSI|nr:hypothetical protein HHK36_002045 [Tetracentron sinense]
MSVPDPLVQVLLQQLLTELLARAQFAIEFQSEFEEMQLKLHFMQAFLTDADNLKKKYRTVRETLTELRELIYEADDILLDCLLKADYRKGSPLCYSFSPKELFYRYRTGKRLSNINVRIGKMEKNFRSYITPIIGQTSQNENNSRIVRWTSQAFDQSEIVGLAEDTRKILGWILPMNEEFHRVGIVGMGGLGKTTITQKIFKDKLVVDCFEKRIWVSVSQTFSEPEIMRSMLKQLGEDESGSDIGELLHKIHQVLTDKRYLIVMDDVWSTVSGWWDRISTGLPKKMGQGSSIIITTRNEDVARSMGVVEARIHRPKILNEEESWSLFCKIAFSATKGVCKNLQFKKVGNDIVKKCRGLPLAIKTIGGLLSSKIHSLGDWKRIYDNFHDELATQESNSSVMASLQLSYDELPAHLKHCILCFSIYPEDYEISADQLVHWWIGEGFVVFGRSAKTALELAFDYLSELISRCLVEVMNRRHYDGRVYFCKMHDMVRDMTIKIARDETFGSFDGKGREIITANSRRLGFTASMDMQPLASNSKLRALLLMTNCQIDLSRKAGLARVKSLRVLDLSHNKLENISIEDLLGWMSSLKRLSYLHLHGVASLRELPYAIGKLLRNLHILVLTECNNLQKLPPSFTTLQRLTVLNIGSCSSLQYLPQGLKRLSNLQDLSGFKLASPAHTDACRLVELKDLTQLRVLRIDISEEAEIADDELTVLSELHQLQVLSINTEECENREILRKLDKLSPPPHLMELYLRYYCGEATPNWINPTSLCELQYLCIENGELTCISPSFWGGNGSPWKIEGLCLKFLPRLQVEWAMVQSAMPLLRYLEVSHCYMLQSFPCNIMNLGYWRKNEEEEEIGEMESI